MRKKAKIIASVTASLAFWLAVLFVVQALVVPKYQSGVVEGSMTEEYYREKLPHEVLMVGDCEVYENISTIELWRKYGITSYIRGSAQQLAWQSYYLLEDALRYETPKVVVFNVLALKYNTPQKEAYNRMCLDGMRWSQSKIDAINASMTAGEHFIDYVFPLLRYHSRWSQLTSDDFRHIFSKDPVTHSGYYMRVDVKPQGELPPVEPLLDGKLGDNAMGYLERMRTLCEEKGIRLVLIKAPTEIPHWYDEWDQQIRQYARENGLSYLNFIPMQEEIGLDMSVDTYDGGLHLNLSGAEKLADYFGAWLTENCDLTDYRRDAAVSAVWQQKEQCYEEAKELQLAEIAEFGCVTSRTPETVKETNIVKNFVILALAAALCLGLAACAGTAKPTEPVEAGYTLSVKGAQIAVNGDMAPILDKLGEPTKYFESESCAFQGLDKVYTFPGLVIRTYPKDGKDYVLSVELSDDLTSTAEGICIGDTAAKVRQVYGEPTSATARGLSYAKGDMVLAFFLENDTVSAITYSRKNNGETGA